MSGIAVLNAIFDGAFIGIIFSLAVCVIKTARDQNVLGEQVKKARDQYEMARDQKMFSLLEEKLSQ